jgi:hypothetical protein
VHLSGDPSQVDGDVTAGVAHADHDDALVPTTTTLLPLNNSGIR